MPKKHTTFFCLNDFWLSYDPNMVADKMGVARRDTANLGAGIYFSIFMTSSKSIMFIILMWVIPTFSILQKMLKYPYSHVTLIPNKLSSVKSPLKTTA